MRTESAAQAKGATFTGNLIPAEGTRLRRMYDLLMANKGIPIDVSLALFENNKSDGKIEALRSFYGLDIRKIRKGRWVLAGEWFGKTYVDYIAERIA